MVNSKLRTVDRVVAKRRIPGQSPRNHISARGQEFLLGEACPADARVSLIEVTCVHFAIHMGKVATGDVAPQGGRPTASTVAGWVNVGASGFFLVGGRVFTSVGHVEDVSAFHAWPSAGMLRDLPHGEVWCENGV